jgi:hypothetical protein
VSSSIFLFCFLFYFILFPDFIFFICFIALSIQVQLIDEIVFNQRSYDDFLLFWVSQRFTFLNPFKLIILMIKTHIIIPFTIYIIVLISQVFKFCSLKKKKKWMKINEHIGNVYESYIYIYIIWHKIAVMEIMIINLKH